MEWRTSDINRKEGKNREDKIDVNEACFLKTF